MKQNFWNKILILAGAIIAANTALADEATNPTTSMPQAIPLSDQQFISDAAVGGMKEVYLSQLALEKSTNADLKGLPVSGAERLFDWFHTGTLLAWSLTHSCWCG